MKTPRRRQNPLRAPLNDILGTEANVRLLRALALAGGPVAAGELARRARLGRTTIYPALEGLERTGIVEFMGVGAQRQAQFRQEHPLGRHLLELFAAEAVRIDALIEALRGTFKQPGLTPIAAWLEGALEDDADVDDALSLWLLADPRLVDVQVEEVGKAVAPIERSYGVRVDLRGTTRSELDSRSATDLRRLKDAIVLGGVPPAALLPADSRRRSRDLGDHSRHDETARRLAVVIAAKLKRDPGLARVAHGHVEKRLHRASPGERKELREWSRMLKTYTPAQLRRFLVGGGEKAVRLRQTLPALGLLTPAERDAVLAAASDAEAVAAVLPG